MTSTFKVVAVTFTVVGIFLVYADIKNWGVMGGGTEYANMTKYKWWARDMFRWGIVSFGAILYIGADICGWIGRRIIRQGNKS